MSDRVYRSRRAASSVQRDDSAASDEPRPVADVLSLDNVARMFRHPRLALRYYELIGLTKRRHRIGRTPVYGWADCDRIAFIIKCRNAGLRLGDIAPIIRAAAGDNRVHSIRFGEDRCAALIDRLERRRQVLDEALAELRQFYSLQSNDVVIRETGADAG
jgi:DNA-binding transcriptional MerR regulator